MPAITRGEHRGQCSTGYIPHHEALERSEREAEICDRKKDRLRINDGKRRKFI